MIGEADACPPLFVMHLFVMKNTLLLSLLIMVLMSCQESFRSRLEYEAKVKTERECPQRLDEVATLDSIVFRNNGTDDYMLFFTLDVDSSAAAAFESIRKAELRATLLQGIKNDIGLAKIRENKLNIVCSFRVKDTGKELCKQRFTAKDYE